MTDAFWILAYIFVVMLLIPVFVYVLDLLGFIE